MDFGTFDTPKSGSAKRGTVRVQLFRKVEYFVVLVGVRVELILFWNHFFHTVKIVQIRLKTVDFRE